jgi:hypothetical protein
MPLQRSIPEQSLPAKADRTLRNQVPPGEGGEGGPRRGIMRVAINIDQLDEGLYQISLMYFVKKGRF